MIYQPFPENVKKGLTILYSCLLHFLYFCRYAMKSLDKKRIKLKQGETLALNERAMLSFVCSFLEIFFLRKLSNQNSPFFLK